MMNMVQPPPPDYNQGGYPPPPQGGYPPQGYPPPGYPPMNGSGYPPQYPPGAYPGYPPPGMPMGGMPMMPGMPMGMPPMGMYQPGVDLRTGFQKMEALQACFIKQKFQLAQAVTGCQVRNQFFVYHADNTGERIGKRKLFKAKEASSWCARNFLSGDCRPFLLRVIHESESEYSNDDQDFLFLERPCACTYLCFNRPEMRVYLSEGLIVSETNKGEYLGKIVSPWKLCDLQIDVYDATDQLKYVIKGSCCQLGVWCQAPCDSCQRIFFQVQDTNGHVMGTLEKRSAGCLKAAISDTTNFALRFPDAISPVDKALLMSAVLFLDFRFFEESPNQDSL